MKKLFLALIAFFLCASGVFAQENDSTGVQISSDSTYDFLLGSLENSDIGFLWGGELSHNNRIGFIGNEFQRIQLRFLSVIQNFDNPYEYFIYGKSRVMENICDFQGSIRIVETGIVKDPDYPELTRAFLKGNYVLFEDQSCLHSGVFRGNFITSVYLDQDGTVYYDDLDKEEEDYINNEFFGQWEKYFTDEILDCNWGDHRIPFSSGLDMGADKFKPSFRYLENGWKEYLEERKRIEEGQEPDKWWN